MSNPTEWYVQGQNFSNSQILKWLKRNFKLGALSLFSPNNVTPKYYHISFLDCLWRLNLTMFKRMKQIWLHEFNDLEPSYSKRFVWFLNTMIFQNGCSKDHILFKKKKKMEIWFFFKKKEKKRKKKREISFQKKKKKSFFFKIQFSWTTSWSDPLWKRYVGSLSKARSQSPKITLENKVKTMWQNCLGAS